MEIGIIFFASPKCERIEVEERDSERFSLVARYDHTSVVDKNEMCKLHFACSDFACLRTARGKYASFRT